MSYQRDSGKYEGEQSTFTTHILSDEITLANEIDDIIVLNISIDGSRTMTAMTGFTEIRNVSSGAVRHIVSWRRATAANEVLPDAVISLADTLSCEAVAILGCPTGSTPIGNSTANTGADAVPTWLTLTPTAHSSIFYLGAMDADTMLTVGDKQIVQVADGGGNSGIMATEYTSDTTATGAVVGTASGPDGWQTLTLEILDDGTPRIPTYFGKPPGSAIDTALYTASNITFRDEIEASGAILEVGGSKTDYTFDGGAVGAGTTIPMAIADAKDNRVYKLEANGNTPPVELTDGEYYYVHKIDASNVSLRLAGLDDQNVSADPYITLSATGSGTITMAESGIAVRSIVDELYNITISGADQHNNYCGSSRTFTTPIDLSSEIFGFKKGTYAGHVLNAIYLFIDSDGDWKWWQINDEREFNDPIQGLIDVDNNTLFKKEQGTFDATSVKHAVMLYLPDGAVRPRQFNKNPTLVTDLVVLGGDTVVPVSIDVIYELLNSYIEGTSTKASFQYGFFHNVQFGDGTDALIFEDSAKSVSFPPLADGTTEFDIYIVDLGIFHKLTAADDISFTVSQIGSDLPYAYETDATSSSSATIDYSNTTLLRATIVLRSGDTREGMIWTAGESVTHNDATITNCVVDNFTRAAGYLVLTTTHNITDTTFSTNTPADYAIEIDTAGTYSLDGITFDGFTKDINVTATTGTVTINISGGGDTPTYQTAGATVVINNAVTINVYVKDSSNAAIEGASVAVYKTSDDSELMNELTAASTGLATESYNYTGSTDVYIRVRKSTTGTRYEPVLTTGTIGSTGLTLTVNLNKDSIAS